MTLNAKVSPCKILYSCKNSPSCKRDFLCNFVPRAILSARANLTPTHFRISTTLFPITILSDIKLSCVYYRGITKWNKTLYESRWLQIKRPIIFLMCWSFNYLSYKISVQILISFQDKLQVVLGVVKLLCGKFQCQKT